MEFQKEKLREKDMSDKEMQARLQLERELAGKKCKTLHLEYEAKFRRHELEESRKMATIPEREPSIGIEQRGPMCTSDGYTWTVYPPGTYTKHGTDSLGS